MTCHPSSIGLSGGMRPSAIRSYPATSRALHDAGFPAITGTMIAAAGGQSVKQSSVNSRIIRVPMPLPVAVTSPMK